MPLAGEVSRGEGWEGTRKSHFAKESRHYMVAAKEAKGPTPAKPLQEKSEI